MPKSKFFRIPFALALSALAFSTNAVEPSEADSDSLSPEQTLNNDSDSLQRQLDLTYRECLTLWSGKNKTLAAFSAHLNTLDALSNRASEMPPHFLEKIYLAKAKIYEHCNDLLAALQYFQKLNDTYPNSVNIADRQEEVKKLKQSIASALPFQLSLEHKGHYYEIVDATGPMLVAEINGKRKRFSAAKANIKKNITQHFHEAIYETRNLRIGGRRTGSRNGLKHYEAHVRAQVKSSVASKHYYLALDIFPGETGPKMIFARMPKLDADKWTDVEIFIDIANPVRNWRRKPMIYLFLDGRRVSDGSLSMESLSEHLNDV